MDDRDRRRAGLDPDDRGEQTNLEFADSGQWDTGQWQRGAYTGEWELGDLAEFDPNSASRGYQAWHRRPEGFWDGLRLADDDPRWVATPASAPRSPAIGQPGRSDLSAVRAGATGGRHRRATVGGVDGADSTRPGIIAAVCYAAAWYVVPLMILFGWMLTLDGKAPPACTTDANGGGCESERAAAVTSIVAATPRFATAVVASIVVAVLLHRISRGWRAASLGLAAAVIGGGLSVAYFQLAGA